MIYSQYEFFTANRIERDWLIAILDDYDFEGYEETDKTLNAFIPATKTNDKEIRRILDNNDFQHIAFQLTELPDKNWNEEWEKNFSPVVIAGRVGIRAPFHNPLNSEFELVIEPKMSFGTGHHATTASVIELMLKEDFTGKAVLDFGCGTGVLAILAEKLGAKSVGAVDIEEWALWNSLENTERNHCVKVSVHDGGKSFLPDTKFDIILANINRNVIVEKFNLWWDWLNDKGTLIVSGILTDDEAGVVTKARETGAKLSNRLHSQGWLAMAFKHA
jgi:ribosomal protein L11 methyltransferase